MLQINYKYFVNNMNLNGIKRNLEGKILTFIFPSAIIFVICGEISHERQEPPKTVKYT